MWFHLKILPLSRKFNLLCYFFLNFSKGENKLTTTKTKKKKTTKRKSSAFTGSS